MLIIMIIFCLLCLRCLLLWSDYAYYAYYYHHVMPTIMIILCLLLWSCLLCLLFWSYYAYNYDHILQIMPIIMIILWMLLCRTRDCTPFRWTSGCLNEAWWEAERNHNTSNKARHKTPRTASNTWGTLPTKRGELASPTSCKKPTTKNSMPRTALQ